jgi:hypothetical protein
MNRRRDFLSPVPGGHAFIGSPAEQPHPRYKPRSTTTPAPQPRAAECSRSARPCIILRSASTTPSVVYVFARAQPEHSDRVENGVCRPYLPFSTPSDQVSFPSRFPVPDEQLATVNGTEDGSDAVLDLVGDEGHSPDPGDDDDDLDDPYHAKYAPSLCMLTPTRKDMVATFIFTRCVKDLRPLAKSF